MTEGDGVDGMTEGTPVTESDVVRDGNGKFDRDPRVADRDAECARLRSRSMTYQQIGDALGITKGMAHAGVARALADTLAEPAEAVRQLELDKLDALERSALDILDREHVIVSQGKVTDIRDDGIALQAVTVLLRVGESRRKLLGLDQPVRMDVQAGVRYVVEGVDTAALT